MRFIAALVSEKVVKIELASNESVPGAGPNQRDA
jgi:hypothetical protein